MNHLIRARQAWIALVLTAAVILGIGAGAAVGAVLGTSPAEAAAAAAASMLGARAWIAWRAWRAYQREGDRL